MTAKKIIMAKAMASAIAFCAGLPGNSAKAGAGGTIEVVSWVTQTKLEFCQNVSRKHD
jgi:hypothetical protein